MMPGRWSARRRPGIVLSAALLLAPAFAGAGSTPAQAQIAGSIWQIAANHGAASQGLKGINPTGCWSTGSSIGGFTCNLAGLSSSNLTAVVNDLAALGMQWVRWEMDADQIDPSCSSSGSSMTWTVTNGAGHDAVISALHTAGIRVMALLNQAPNCMNGSSNAATGITTAGGRTSWSNFATAVAQRYGASGTTVLNGIQAYEIWNEPNCAIFWLPSADPANYEALVAASYTALKAVDSAAIVVVGSLAPCGDSGTAQTMETFLANLYADGLAGHENAISAHPYCASPVGAAGCDNIRKMYDATYHGGSGTTCLNTGSPETCTLLSIMTENGEGSTQIWMTEWGVESSQIAGGVTQTQQATDLSNLYALANANKNGWAGPVFWYNYQDFVTAHGTGADGKAQCTTADDPAGQSCFGIEAPAAAGVGAAKSAYAAYQNAP
jgi:hypothetical protein